MPNPSDNQESNNIVQQLHATTQEFSTLLVRLQQPNDLGTCNVSAEDNGELFNKLVQTKAQLDYYYQAYLNQNCDRQQHNNSVSNTHTQVTELFSGSQPSPNPEQSQQHEEVTAQLYPTNTQATNPIYPDLDEALSESAAQTSQTNIMSSWFREITQNRPESTGSSSTATYTST